jgi:putative transcriptional regulator
MSSKSPKKSLFSDLKESLDDVKDFYKGKVTLKTWHHSIEKPQVYTPKQIAAIRARLHLSQALFAALCNVSLKTIHAWEQGLRTPAGPALRLLSLLDKAPDTILNQLKSA